MVWVLASLSAQQEGSLGTPQASLYYMPNSMLCRFLSVVPAQAMQNRVRQHACEDQVYVRLRLPVQADACQTHATVKLRLVQQTNVVF